MSVRLSPIAISATSQQYLVSFDEKLCSPYCAPGAIKPSVSVEFSELEKQTVGTQTVVTIGAAITVVYQPSGSCRSITRQFSEQFDVCFIEAPATTPSGPETTGSSPTVSLSTLETIVSVPSGGCSNQVRTVSASVPLTISVAYSS